MVILLLATTPNFEIMIIITLLSNTCGSLIGSLFLVFECIYGSRSIVIRWCIEKSSSCESLLWQSTLWSSWLFLTRKRWRTATNTTWSWKSEWITLIHDCLGCTSSAFLGLGCACSRFFEKERLKEVFYLSLILEL